MATTIHVGKKRVQTVTTSDGSALAPGAVTAVADSGAVSVAVDPDTNAVTLTANAPANVQINYDAAGYVGAIESITVLPQPGLIVTDGLEQ